MPSMPSAPPPDTLSGPTHTLTDLAALLRGRRFTVLTGAGCSTESGIPDYRGPETRRRARNPIQGRDFLRSAEIRRRYWARALVGWERFRRAEPNAAHHALASLDRAGLITRLITQNVDGLHQAAGSREVIELHGSLHEVGCLVCGALERRDDVQARLVTLNPGFGDRAVEMAPDGDAELPAPLVDGFQLADCLACGGPLKPRVVFFGENVARELVESAYAAVEQGTALLVVGSSLAVFSGYRFLLRAVERGIPVALVNLGGARGDDRCAVRVEARAGEALPALVAALCGDGREADYRRGAGPQVGVDAAPL